jgi:hypothetical protein
MSEGVTACIALASAGGVDGSFFTAKRALPRASRHSQGDSNVTDDIAAAMQRNAMAAIVNVSRVIALGYITLSLLRTEQKATDLAIMKHEITILSVKDSNEPSTNSVLRTKMGDLIQTASIAKERAEHLRPHTGETMSLDKFFDLVNEPLFE